MVREPKIGYRRSETCGISKTIPSSRRHSLEMRRAESCHWLRYAPNFTDAAWQVFESLRESNLKTVRVWVLRESAMCLFDCVYEGAARRRFNAWYNWATHNHRPLHNTLRKGVYTCL
jgi:hypothetical protein